MKRPSIKRTLVLLMITMSAVVLLAAAYAALATWTTIRVPPRTTLAGIDVGGMSRATAEEALREAARPTQAPMRLLADGTVIEVLPSSAGLTADIDATMALVDRGGWSPREIASWFTGTRSVTLVGRVDEPALTRFVNGLARQVREPAREPTLQYVGTRAVLTEGADGRQLDTRWAASTLARSFLVARLDIPLRLDQISPQVSETDALDVQRAAQTLINQNLVFRSGDATGTLSRRQLAKAISFATASGRLSPTVDGELLAHRLIAKVPEFEQPGTDAALRIRRGRPVVVPAIFGTTVDPAGLARLVGDAVRAYPPSGPIEIPRIPLEPDLTDAEASQLGITERLSSFTQAFPYAPYRVQNIGQAADYIDGTILMAGETFSLNETIKERTVANGYTEGIIIGPGGVFAEDLGGGVSAAATATWTAAFFAGLERVETRAHSIYISRYQPGLEATVAWGIFDMRFRNDTPNAVLISAKTTNTSMKVQVWGTRVFDDVRAEFGPRTNIRPYSTIQDSSAGCIGQSGMAGFDIVVDRVFVMGGGVIKRESIPTSYKPSPQVVCR